MAILPQSTYRTFISVSMAPGRDPEAPITSKEYLSSYLEHACWLRLLSAKRVLGVLEESKSSDLERLAAVASFSQLAGQITEDALTTYVAWSIWAADRDLRLPDIFARLSLRMSSPSKRLTPDYISDIHRKMSETEKRVDVYPREYLAMILSQPDDRLPLMLGINWKKHPSVKLVPPEMRPFWDAMGSYVRGTIQPLIDPKGQLLSSTYNKIKHGPQLIVMSIGESALRRGHNSSSVESLDRSGIRLLLDGSRVQETPEELEDSVRCAPFLVDDIANARRWFFQQMVHQVNALYALGTWLFNTTYIDDKREFSVREEIQELVRSQREHMAAFP